MTRLSHMESPEEMRSQGKQYLAQAVSEDDPSAAEALRRWAHVAFELAAWVERGGAMPATH